MSNINIVACEPDESLEITSNISNALSKILPQLSQSAEIFTLSSLQTIIRHDACTLLIAYLNDELVGCAMLAVYPAPTGTKAWIEDVVVDESARGLGVGEKLTRELIKVAKEAGAKSVNLTSRPERKAANKLYQKIGFELRDTNTYKLEV